MALTRKDGAATALTILVVLTFLATHQGWNVWLVGDSHRWAAGAIMALGLATCGLGSPGTGVATKICATLGILAVGLGVLALVTASLTPLSLLVVDTVVLWALATWEHARHAVRKPIIA